MTDTPRSIATLLQNFQAGLPKNQAQSLTFMDIITTFHERGFGLILLFIALPMALPIPVPPVINVLLATPLLVLTAQQALGREALWLPRSIAQKHIQVQTMCALLDKTIPFLIKMEALTKPRLSALTSKTAQRVTGLLGFIMALYVMIPLPLTNTVPSLAIAIMALGVLTRDGLSVIAGAVIGLIWVGLLSYALLFFGVEGLDWLKSTIKSVL